MYYKVALIIYFILIAFCFYTKSINNKEDNKKYKKEFSNFAKEQMEAYSDWRSGKLEHEANRRRKRNLKNLNGKEKFILYMGMFSIFFGFLVFVALYLIIRNKVIPEPKNVLFFEYMTAFQYLGCFASIVSSVLLSVPLKRLIDRNNIMESVSGEPPTTFKQDLYIISILLLICFPIIVFCMNTYRYADDKGFYCKTIFSLKEHFYSYEDFDYVEKNVKNDWHDYNVVLKNKKNMKLYDDVYIPNEEALLKVLDNNNILVKENN